MTSAAFRFPALRGVNLPGVFTEDQVLSRLRWLTDLLGVDKVAAICECSPGLVKEMLEGTKELSNSTLNALGFSRTSYYVMMEVPDATATS